MSHESQSREFSSSPDFNIYPDLEVESSNKVIKYVYPDAKEFNSQKLIILEDDDFDERVEQARSEIFHPTLLKLDRDHKLQIPLTYSFDSESPQIFYDFNSNELFFKKSVIPLEGKKFSDFQRTSQLIQQGILKGSIAGNIDPIENVTGSIVNNVATKMVSRSIEGMLQRSLPWNQKKQLMQIANSKDLSARLFGAFIEFRLDGKVALPFLGISWTEMALYGIIAGPQEVLSDTTSRMYAEHLGMNRTELKNNIMDVFKDLNILDAGGPEMCKLSSGYLADLGVNVVNNPRQTFDQMRNSTIAQKILDNQSKPSK